MRLDVRIKRRRANELHHGRGIRPTVPVEPTIAGIAQGRDEVLERAIAVVGGEVRTGA